MGGMRDYTPENERHTEDARGRSEYRKILINIAYFDVLDIPSQRNGDKDIIIDFENPEEFLEETKAIFNKHKGKNGGKSGEDCPEYLREKLFAELDRVCYEKGRRFFEGFTKLNSDKDSLKYFENLMKNMAENEKKVIDEVEKALQIAKSKKGKGRS